MHRGSELIEQPKERLQDTYSFRCMPQVHGATLDVIDFVKQVVEREINSVSDNPLVFADVDKIVSAGNFHGQPWLLPSLSEIGNVSERRTDQLLSGAGGLPLYLVKKPGLNSGFMPSVYGSEPGQSEQAPMHTGVGRFDRLLE